MVFNCPSCKADLYARPPRSYAEMEGLIDSPATNQDQRSRSIPIVRRCSPSSMPNVRADWRLAERLVIGATLLMLIALCISDLLA